MEKGVLPDWLIEKKISIAPFTEAQVAKGTISYGVTSYGYDARVGYKFKVFDPGQTIPQTPCRSDRTVDAVDPAKAWRGMPVIDPKNKDWHGFFEEIDLANEQKLGNAAYIIIPPNSFALAETMETFEIPRDILAVCVGKSTYARCGIIVNVTPLEPEWRGKVTVEISNTTPLPAKIYAGEGIMQILFFTGAENCKKSYAEKTSDGGKYQNQTGLTMPLVAQPGK